MKLMSHDLLAFVIYHPWVVLHVDRSVEDGLDIGLGYCEQSRDVATVGLGFYIVGRPRRLRA